MDIPFDGEKVLSGMERDGLQVKDRAFARAVLEEVSGFHLQEFGRPFLEEGQEAYRAGTTFEMVYESYRADRFCKNFLFDYLAEIEVQLRNLLGGVLQEAYGNFGYLKAENFQEADHHSHFMNDIKLELDRANEPYVNRERKKYGDQLPIYIAVELLTFGDLAKLYQNMKSSEKAAINGFYGFVSQGEAGEMEGVFASYLEALTFLRNTCAHHGRLSNRAFPDACLLAPVDQSILAKEEPGFVCNERGLFANILAMTHLLHPDKGAGLARNFEKLFESYPTFDLNWMNFPHHWEEVLAEVRQARKRG